MNEIERLINDTRKITWYQIIELFKKNNCAGYLTYDLNQIYSKIYLNLYPRYEIPKYIIGENCALWINNKNMKEIRLNFKDVNILTFPAPWDSLTLIREDGT